ncbi:hypothetical protein GVN21_11775 [Caulobacter sp. SLTY]|uniref:hypothetical protein n=1 Tax=Caulobacter sp. SLTY TaxID=2683262 RepID=UPI00141341D5|nr:hypothetical protein [Caulobacter sp. SLTY]NBB16036.1 hypothetical protein [Caulobacter sp. SLTY]
MTETTAEDIPEFALADRPKGRRGSLYPLQIPLMVVGAVGALFCLVFQDWIVAISVFSLFALVGASWRADMLPVIPACIAFQWVSCATGYIYHHNVGRYPGGGYPEQLAGTVLLALLGLAAVVIGIRAVMALFKDTVFAKTLAPVTRYNMNRVFILTLVVFSISYVVDVLPQSLWFGGAQIIENLLALRFVPYFLLLVAAFERGRGFTQVVVATLWVTAPQLLTGFSDFKEILFVVIIAALAQWRPWVRTRVQRRQNTRILLFGAFGAVVVLLFGIVWSGGVKQEWRDQIWREDVNASPVARMGLFFDTVGRVVPKIKVGKSIETLSGRIASGTLYFTYVVERVPRVVAHENGTLIGKAIANATQPRFLFPNKAELGGDSWLVRTYAGVNAAGDESGASIGLGYMAEFFIDFGIPGVLGLSLLWGAVGGGVMVLMAKVCPSREIFLAVVIGIFTQYFMAFDGSMIKLFAGLLQRTLIAAAVLAFIGPRMQAWLLTRRRSPAMMMRNPMGSPQV